MDTEHAGLDLVREVCDGLRNRFVRIVLRTGHPGQTPEREVIRTYDINDYTELTAVRLETTVLSALRAYREIATIEAARVGLERVVEASAQVLSRHKIHEFASAVLAQLATLVEQQRGALCAVPKTNHAITDPIYVAAATGEFERSVTHAIEESLPASILTTFHLALSTRQHVFDDDHYVLHFSDAVDSKSLLIVAEAPRLSDLDLHLIKVYCTNVDIAFDNLHLNQDLFESQLEMICLLASAAETRSRETANHVKRVGLLAEFIAREYGMDECGAEALRFAAPLHDIGKIAVPVEILNKRGPHTPQERAIMRTHAEYGAQLLGKSRLPLIRLVAEIAWTHHENWDGSGYPRGLRGVDIPLSGHITALAGVFDALGSRRCYMAAWEREDILATIHRERGRKFEPRLVDVLIAKWDLAESARQMLPD